MDSQILRSYLLVIAIYICLIPLLIVTLGPRLDRLAGLPPFMPSPANIAAGLVILAYAWFWIAWSQHFLVKRGKGHPNEILGRELSPLTTRLVIDGPYRHSRNPMAYGLLIFYFLALPLLCNSTLALLLFPVACVFEVWYHKKYEEPGLLNRFGDEFARYREQVPLLFPFLRRARG
ncbi:MAG: hypothetical protein NT045_07560 [Candidatus Aureabacteria bacterium]|nr:hypothetical protein [Candidatus Auribacterota bacterium]